MTECRSVPRVIDCITVKRNTPLTARSYGHWWIEVGASESYGWWPQTPLGLLGIVRGTPGVLNGQGVVEGGSPMRDPHHGLVADHVFHPVLVVDSTDANVRAAIRRFATAFVGEWRWSTRPTMNCRLFQLMLMDFAGLVDGNGNYHSRGAGCPALAPVRRAAARVTGQRRWPGNLPRPGQPGSLWWNVATPMKRT